MAKEVKKNKRVKKAPFFVEITGFGSGIVEDCAHEEEAIEQFKEDMGIIKTKAKCVARPATNVELEAYEDEPDTDGKNNETKGDSGQTGGPTK